jgi:cephalosporin-C deacetylase-like acetyl esterase
VRASEDVRQRFFWQKLKTESPAQWSAATIEFKTMFWRDIIGALPSADIPINPRTRKFDERKTWTGYEVVLDVWNDVFAWGYLLLPKDLRPGERRPVVVCQHGLEGLPADTVTNDSSSRAYGYYKAFAAQLAERGFIVFAPHNPYRGRDDFRGLQRKLNPLKKTLYSVIAAQHSRILDWLGTQPFVDPTRIAFYGLSYGGKTAMRIPVLFDRYALSICSGDFNEWIRKNTSVDARNSYMFTGEYEMFEFNLGNTFNYAEMAALIAPRPFMVERGHYDGVGTDEWVSYEFAKVRRLYTQLGIPERAAIEYFDGPHTINGQGTFDFLHTHLNWPKRK